MSVRAEITAVKGRFALSRSTVTQCDPPYEVVVVSRATVLAEALWHWLGRQGQFVPRGVADPVPPGRRAGVVLVIDEGDPHGPFAGEASWPTYPRVYLSPALTPVYLLEALRLKAVAALPLCQVEEGLSPTLVAACQGLPLPGLQALLDAFPRPPSPDARLRPPTVRLTARELQIGCALARGESYQRIAGRLFLGAKTVEFHAAKLLQRLQLSDRYAVAEYFNRVFVCRSFCCLPACLRDCPSPKTRDNP